MVVQTAGETDFEFAGQGAAGGPFLQIFFNQVCQRQQVEILRVELAGGVDRDIADRVAAGPKVLIPADSSS